MTTTSTSKCSSTRYVKATCVAGEDLGKIETKFGKKRMGKLTFETDEKNEYGEKRRLTRLFHIHTHPKSTLSLIAKSWCNRDLAAEEENLGALDMASFVDSPARLKLEPGAVKEGRQFDNIVEILPLNDAEEIACESKETQAAE